MRIAFDRIAIRFNQQAKYSYIFVWRKPNGLTLHYRFNNAKQEYKDLLKNISDIVFVRVIDTNTPNIQSYYDIE